MTARPTTGELLDAVAEFLTETAATNLTGRDAFHAKVAANVLRIVERELAAQSADISEELAVAVRDAANPLSADLFDRLATDVMTRIAIDNPTYASVADAHARWPWTTSPATH